MRFDRERRRGILSSLHDQALAFDNKASIILTVFGILLGLVATSFCSVYSTVCSLNQQWLVKWAVWSFSIFFFSGAFPLAFSLAAIFPRKDPLRGKDLNYYWGIASYDANTYCKELSANQADDDEQLNNQIWKNAKIVKTKHICVALAIYSLIPFGLSFLSSMFCLVYIIFISSH